MEFVHHSHSVGNNVHHLQWCTKYRYKMFRKPKYAAICEAAIRRAAERHEMTIKEIAVMPDHIHVVAQIPPHISQSRAIQLLKGGSAYEIFRLCPKFRHRYTRGHLWSRGNFKDSVGRLTEDVAKNYVRNQSQIHNLYSFINAQ